MLKNKEAVAPLLFFCHQLMLFFAVSSTAFCFAFSTDFTQLLYHHDDSYHAKIFGSLLLSFVPISFVYVYGTLLLAGGKLKEINAISAIGVVINVVLNILLVKSYAAYGSVIATAITQLMVSASFVYLCYKDFKLPFEMWLYIKNVGFILSIGASLWLLVFYKINFYQAALLYSLGAVLLAFIWQLFSINDLKNKLQLFTKK
jgi:O-antigen/teichoic acid export membrane protein